MALLNLETLVLRGSVLGGGLALTLRRGTSVEAEPTPVTGPSMRRHLAHSRYWPTCPVACLDRGCKPADKPEEGTEPGAGRSRRQAGLATRRPPQAAYWLDTKSTNSFAVAARHSTSAGRSRPGTTGIPVVAGARASGVNRPLRFPSPVRVVRIASRGKAAW